MAMRAPDGRFLRVNRALCEITGYSREQLEATTYQSITHPDDLARDEKGYREVMSGHASHYRTEKRYIHADGHVVPVDLSATVVRDDGDGEPVHVLTQVQDITERKRFEGQLQYLADHDSLTGLFNRRRFEEELTRELASAERYESKVAVLAIDLDDFKYINDSLGHSIGDELITRGPGGAQPAAAHRRARPPRRRRVRRGPAAHRRRRRDGGGREPARGGRRGRPGRARRRGGGRVSASIGIAMFHAASQLTSELLVEADIAMYDAKEAGRARAVLYDATEDREERMLAHDLGRSDPRRPGRRRLRALRAAGDVAGRRPVPRSELLLRMQGEDGDVIPPGSFLYIAERFDLIQEIDRWVVSRAIEILSEEQAAGREVVLCVNLSAKSVVSTRRCPGTSPAS